MLSAFAFIPATYSDNGVLSTISNTCSTTPNPCTYQTVIQTQWRTSPSDGGTPFGTLSPYSPIDDSGPYYPYVSTGNSLHEMFEYKPSVTNQAGGIHAYTFDSTTGNYTMHSGIISYTSPYTGLTVYEVWNGYLSFNSVLFSSRNDFATSGQLNQWAFVYSPSGQPSAYPDSVSAGSGYWLVGFSTYTYGQTPAPSSAAFFSLAMGYPHVP